MSMGDVQPDKYLVNMKLYYLRMTWVVSTIGLNIWTYTIFDWIFKLDAEALTQASVKVVLTTLMGFSIALATISVAIYTKWIVSKAASIVPFAFCWGLNSPIFMYGLLAAAVSHNPTLKIPFIVLNFGLNLLMFPRTAPYAIRDKETQPNSVGSIDSITTSIPQNKASESDKRKAG